MIKIQLEGESQTWQHYLGPTRGVVFFLPTRFRTNPVHDLGLVYVSAHALSEMLLNVKC